MLSSTSEKKLRYVRALLLAGWSCLILSLFWDPYSHVLTDPASLFSPLAPWISSIQIQGQWVDQNPYPLGNRIFWTMLVPLLPIAFMVFGHETWRRICPLSFVSQIPGYLGLRRWLHRVDRVTGKRVAIIPVISRNSWLAKNATWVQFGLLVLGLCMRLWFANSDRMGLAFLLLGIIACALLVGVLWGGKTWCHYFCPVGIVQKIYTEPSGLLDSKPHIQIASLPQSMCRTPSKEGDISACVGCTASCPDIDLEKSYWDQYLNPNLQTIYFGFFGLIWGFYTFFYLYSGDWLYYFSGIWTHEDQLGQLMGPGLYIDDTPIAIPKLLSVPLVLLTFVFLGIVVGRILAKTYIAIRKRKNPALSMNVLTHQVLVITAYLSINSFYIFGGRPTLLSMPLPVSGLISLLFVALTTLWLMKALRRSEGIYKNEGLAPVFLKQLKTMRSELAAFLGGRKLESMSADEICLLAVAPGLQSEQQRLAGYRALLEEFARDSAPQLLSTIRDAQLRLRITTTEHQFITRELQLFLPYGGEKGDYSDARTLSILAFRQALAALASEHQQALNAQFLSDSSIAPELERLKGVYAITEAEWVMLQEQFTSAGDAQLRILSARIEELADITSLKLLLRSQRGINQEWDQAANLMNRELLEETKQLLRRIFAILLSSAGKDGLAQFARKLSSLAGSELELVLEENVPTEKNRKWYEALAGDILDSLVIHANAHGSAEVEHLPTLHAMLGKQESGIEQLAMRITHGNSCQAAIAYVLLKEIDAPRALKLARDKCDSSDTAVYWLLAELLDERERYSLSSNMEKFLCLANTALLSQVPLARIAEIAQQSSAELLQNGQLIFAEGDHPDAAIFLASGELEVLKSSGQVLAKLEAGALTGELGILTGRPRMASLKVHSSEAQIIKINAADLNSLIERDSMVAASILKTVAGYI